jgi:4-oxalmesaconate hydratase
MSSSRATGPPVLEAWRNRQTAGLADPSVAPAAADLHISDDDLPQSIEANKLRLMTNAAST